MKLYLRLFLAMAIPYGLMMSVFMLHPVAGILSGVIFGGVMALIFGTVQHLSFRGKKTQASRSVKQARRVELDLTLDEAFNLCLETYKPLRKAVVKKIDRENSIIEIRTGMNWLTYGEIVTLKLSMIDRVTTAVSISSRPRVKTTMIDYGRNLQNVNLIAMYLREQIAADHLSVEAMQQTPLSQYLQDEQEMLHSLSRSR